MIFDEIGPTAAPRRMSSAKSAAFPDSAIVHAGPTTGMALALPLPSAGSSSDPSGTGDPRDNAIRVDRLQSGGAPDFRRIRLLLALRLARALR